ncbi:bifunctional purine biosynthesis protein purH [Sesbania bispinosa]|nr:bifunctional purine biosynthesis protein purH [Sesbania bispinosa]
MTALESAGVVVTKVKQLTKFPEMLGCWVARRKKEREATEEGISEVVGELEGETVKRVGTGLEGKGTILKEIVSREYFEGF